MFRMGRKLSSLPVLCAALCATAGAQSGVPRAMDACSVLTPAEAEVKAFVLHPVLGGAELQRRIERVLQVLSWQRTLADARAEAQRRSRPILWVQSLGDLEGFA